MSPLAHRSYLVFFRFILFNLVVAAIGIAIYLQGWLDDAFSGLTFWLSTVIFVVFVYGWLASAARIWQIAHETELLNIHTDALAVVQHVVKLGPGERSLAAEVLRLGLLGRIQFIHYVTNSLVLLGLVGTVVGFIVALGGIDPEDASRVEEVAPMVATLIQGMSIALYTTLFGAITHLWLGVNYRVLRGATVEYYRKVLEVVRDVGV